MTRRRKTYRSSHADQTVTDLGVRRVSVASGTGYVAFGWDYPGATLLEVRIVRSQREFAREPDDPARPVSQHIVYQGAAGSFRDTTVESRRTYYYTIFARHPGQLDWTVWERFKMRDGGVAGPSAAGRALGAAGRALAAGRARGAAAAPERGRGPLAWARAGLRRLLR